MTLFIKWFLPIFFILYFLIAFVLKSIITSKNIGKSALVLPKNDTVYGYVGRNFSYTIIGLLVYVLLYSILDRVPKWSFFQIISYLGLLVLVIGFVITVIAQYQMKNSWRIGIDINQKTELITHGVFRFSRNPIFFGMILNLVGLCLIIPNVISLSFLFFGNILIQIQIRLEEEHLEKAHTTDYINYKNKVGRFFTFP